MFSPALFEDTERIKELQKILDALRAQEQKIVQELRALVYKIER